MDEFSKESAARKPGDDQHAEIVLRRLRLSAGLAVLAFCLVGVAFLTVIRDGVDYPWYLFYYALPRPAIAVLAGIAAVLLMNSRWLGRFAACLMAGLILWGLVADWGWRRAPAVRQPGELRIAQWNAGGHPIGWEPSTRLPVDWLPMTAEIRGWNADLIGIVECGEGPNSHRDNWLERFPGYDVDQPQTGLVLLVRGRILHREDISCGLESHATWYDVDIDGQQLRFVLVDVASSLAVPRTEALSALWAAMSSWSDQPVLMAGDFNLPPGSRCLEPFRQAGYREAFEAAGSGYAPTWPNPVPVLTLDQIWGSPNVQFHSSSRFPTARSDHRPIFTDISINRPPAPVEGSAK